MHRSIAGHNPYNLFTITVDLSMNFTTMKLLTIEHMVMFVVKSIHIQSNGQVCACINSTTATDQLKIVGFCSNLAPFGGRRMATETKPQSAAYPEFNCIA